MQINMHSLKGFLIGAISIILLPYALLRLASWHPWNPPINLTCVSYDGSYEIWISIDYPQYKNHIFGTLSINNNNTGEFINNYTQGINFKKDDYRFKNAVIIETPNSKSQIFLLDNYKSAIYWEPGSHTEKLFKCFPGKT